MRVRGARQDDLEAIASLLAPAGASAKEVLARLRKEWRSPGFEVGADSFVAEDGDSVVAYGALTPARTLMLVAAAEDTADRLIGCLLDRAREQGVAAVTVTVDSEESALALAVARQAFERLRTTLLMRRDLHRQVEHASPPAGVTLRTFVPADAQAVHRLLDDAYAAWDRTYVRTAHDEWVRLMTGDSEFDATVWWLAERGDELVGCAPHWESGWLKDLAVASTERGRGLGAALVTTGLAEFRRRGVPSAGLKVDAANPTGAVRLYERLGFVTEQTETVWVRTP